jgi:DNA-binding beta-propeller fold protein YncE
MLHAAGPGTISTIVGRVSAGFSGDGGAARMARIGNDGVLAFDSEGNLFIGDNSNSRIRRVDAVTGIISTICGDGTAQSSGDGGLASLARISSIQSLVVDDSENLYFSEISTHRIRRIDLLTGIISTIAGNGTPGYSGDGGPASSSRLNQPGALALDSEGNLYVADSGNWAVRRIDRSSTTITTFAGGNGFGYGGNGGAARNAVLGALFDMAFDSGDNLFLLESGPQIVSSASSTTYIRRIDKGSGSVSEFSRATNAEIGGEGLPVESSNLMPHAIAFDSSDNLYLTEPTRIRVVDAISQRVRTIAGMRDYGYSGPDGGLAVQTRISWSSKVGFDGSDRFVFYDGFRIRAVEGGLIPARFLPDLSIGRKMNEMSGVNRVNASGSGQTAFALAGPPHYGAFVARLENSATTLDRISVSIQGMDREFRRFLGTLYSDSNVYRQSSDRFSVILNPGESLVFRVYCLARPPRGSRKASFRVVARSESVSATVDVVRVEVGDFDLRDPRLMARPR